jgi:hypothetical protein
MHIKHFLLVVLVTLLLLVPTEAKKSSKKTKKSSAKSTQPHEDEYDNAEDHTDEEEGDLYKDEDEDDGEALEGKPIDDEDGTFEGDVDEEPNLPDPVRGVDLWVNHLYIPEVCDTDHAEIAEFKDKVSLQYTLSIDEHSHTGEPKKVLYTSSEPLEVTLGEKEVVEGLEEGLLGICAGEKRVIVVPPKLAYGDIGHAQLGVPGNSTLMYEVEALKLDVHADNKYDMEEDVVSPDIFKEMDGDGDGKITKEEMVAWFKQDGEEIPEGLWEEEDVNKDGFVTLEEFTGPKGADDGTEL